MATERTAVRTTMKGALALGLIVLSITSTRSVARADVEVGVFAGGHVFSEDGELGTLDTSMGPTLDSFALFGGRFGLGLGRFLGLEAEALVIPTEDSSGGTASVLGFRGHALFHFLGGKVRPFALAGAGGHMVKGDGFPAVYDDTDFAWHYGLGVKLQLSRRVLLRLDGRHLFVPSRLDDSVTNDFEGHLGLSFKFGGATAAPPPPPPPPPPPRDTDGDGLNDLLDKCPREAEDRDGFEDEDGCPEADNDADGIKDEDDKCPLEAETKNGVDDEDGCPEKDEDGDGLVGSADKCPTEPEDKDQFQDEDGCPDPDNDGDGVLDADDKCPTELETPNGYLDGDGCKDELPKALAKFTGVIRGIEFKKGSAAIQKKSNRTLDAAVKIFKAYPDIKIEVGGHTSEEGSPERNQELSKERAEAVREYLITKDVAPDRITAVGYGPSQPKGDNATAKGRRMNRRIEFRLISAQVK